MCPAPCPEASRRVTSVIAGVPGGGGYKAFPKSEARPSGNLIQLQISNCVSNRAIPGA